MTDESGDDPLATSGAPPHALRALARVAETLGLATVTADARALVDRVAAGRFYVAVVGQFKRGKSTLIDALLDDAVLPAGIVPVTAVPTVVRFGSARTARVRLRDADGGAWQPIAPEALAEYVSEERNPENVRRVLGVEVLLPLPLLESGMCLVDTPGLGSVFEGNTRATREFVPQIDAAVVVIGADPPISGEELDLIADVARHVGHLIIVLNKADRVTDEERRVAGEFARAAIERRIGRPVDRIFEVSALERLRDGRSTRDWAALVATLEHEVARSGAMLVRAAGCRGLQRLVARLRAAIAEERGALERPIEESARRLDELDAAIADGERAIADLDPLFTAEQRRLSRAFAADRAAFLAETRPQARAALDARLARLTGRHGPALRRGVLAAAQEIAREVIRPWLDAQQARAATAYAGAVERFVRSGESLLDRLAQAGVPALAHVSTEATVLQSLAPSEAFRFKDVIRVAQPASPLRYGADLILGLAGARAFRGDAIRFLDWLLEMNSARVQSDVEERVAESRRQLERHLRARLAEAAARARAVFDRARAARAEGAAAVEAETTRLAGLEMEIDAIARRSRS